MQANYRQKAGDNREIRQFTSAMNVSSLPFNDDIRKELLGAQTKEMRWSREGGLRKTALRVLKDCHFSQQPLAT